MPRVKLYEHSAKKAMSQALDITYCGVRISDSTTTPKLPNAKYVVKVDQGVKKRMKNGLVILGVKANEINAAVEKICRQSLLPLPPLTKRGTTASPHSNPPPVEGEKIYNNFLVEEFLAHKPSEEKYFSLELERDGVIASVSKKGGIDIEEDPGSVKRLLFVPKNYPTITKIIGLKKDTLEKINKFFNDNYFCFLEINPLVVKNGKPYFLDLAATVDSAAEFFVPGVWGENDIVPVSKDTPEERAVANLKAHSQAALSLSVVNPNGSVFLLMSGGGASIVLADEVYNLGAAADLVNYGEYSGNPNEEETYEYTKQIISLMKKSHAKKKTLIIGGGVANFTDVRVTFNGIIRAFNENLADLKKMKAKIFVRRGGPGQIEGLAKMEKFLKTNKINGGVYDQKLPLQKIVEIALK